MNEKDKKIEAVEIDDVNVLPEVLDGKHRVIPIVSRWRRPKSPM